MKFLKSISLILLLLCFKDSVYSAINTAVVTGNWSNVTNWSNGVVPGCGDLIEIPAGITITVNMHVNLDENSTPSCASASYIVIYGILQFTTGNKIRLACGSGVEIFSGGSALPGSGGGNSNLIEICGVAVWNSADGVQNGYKLFGEPAPLPIEFIEFSVSKNNENIDLIWTVASERENDYFTVVYSLDGSNWIPFVQVNSIGDHTDGYIYNKSESIKDFNFGEVYFRLSQSDINGKISVLDIKSFDNDLQEVLVYPNPAKLGNGIAIALNSSSAQIIEILFYNSIGQVVYNEIVLLTAGMNQIVLNPTNVTKGLYLVKIPSISGTDLQRLIIE